MWILDALFEAMRGDPDPLYYPPEPQATVDVVQMGCELRALRVERDCYKAELTRYGMNDKALSALVTLYIRGLRASAGLRGKKAS